MGKPIENPKNCIYLPFSIFMFLLSVLRPVAIVCRRKKRLIGATSLHVFFFLCQSHYSAQSSHFRCSFFFCSSYFCSFLFHLLLLLLLCRFSSISVGKSIFPFFSPHCLDVVVVFLGRQSIECTIFLVCFGLSHLSMFLQLLLVGIQFFLPERYIFCHDRNYSQKKMIV